MYINHFNNYNVIKCNKYIQQSNTADTVKPPSNVSPKVENVTDSDYGKLA